ncbi:MAG: hypothetical protein IJ829_06015, partial [Kiritimatiellae bacterium]|nr:hypothetical protein [Kiritimatiellia bacterium]
CRAMLARGERLKVAFLVCDASMFSGESVFLEMRGDARFDCFVAVAPRTSRGEEFLRATQEKTLASLSAKYGDAVRALYDPDAKTAAALDADLVFSTIVYEDQSLPQYTTEALSARALVAVLYYGYGGLFDSNEKKTSFLPNIVLAWRYFVSNEASRAMFTARNPLLAAATVVSGYCKMDRLAGELDAAAGRARRRKKVLVCPHHTIDRSADALLALSTFPANADALLRLPSRFPEVDFVFRPHPLLFVRLASPKWWGPEKVAAYCRAMESQPNVEFQRGGDYFSTFAESDALIHDCASFLAEYFYTGRPQCYMLAGTETIDRHFLPFARRLVDHAYKAFSEEDIVAFVRDVVLGGDDPLAADRARFAAEEVCVNHPHAARRVVDAALAGIEKEES